MRHSESPLILKSTLLAIYGRHVARVLRDRNMYRTADQLEGAVLSIRNNIGEAQSPQSRRDFVHKLKISQKETFEAEGILATRTVMDGVTPAEKQTLCELVDEVGRMLTSSIATAIRNSH